LVEAVWGCGSVTSSLAVRVALAASAPPSSRFLPATPCCGAKELVDGPIAWQAWRPRLFSLPFLCSVYA
jgi:hypothetical protein